MRSSRDFLCLTAITACLTLTQAVGAGLSNGSFESPVLSAYGETFSVAPPALGWTIATGDVDMVTAEYWQPAHANQSIDLNGTTAASIYQDITFTNAGTWSVQFSMSANPDLIARGDGLGSGLKTVRVEFGVPGQMTHLGTYSLDSAPRTIANMSWVTMTTPQIVVSNAVAYRLQFTSLTEGTAGPVLDNVVLQPCSPASTLRVSEVEFCWNSESQRLYQVQYRSELTTNRWMNLLQTNVVGTGDSICIPDRVAVGQPQRFYQVLCVGE